MAGLDLDRYSELLSALDHNPDVKAELLQAGDTDRMRELLEQRLEETALTSFNGLVADLGGDIHATARVLAAVPHDGGFVLQQPNTDWLYANRRDAPDTEWHLLAPDLTAAIASLTATLDERAAELTQEDR
jgi:hypothetical protein